MDHEIELANLCGDLLSEREHEPLVRGLLSRPKAAWIRVSDLASDGAQDISDDLYAAWLDDPSAHSDYAMIVFFDDDSLWSMAGRYNRALLACST